MSIESGEIMEREFNKLVRDYIPDKIESNGEVAVTRVLNDVEYKDELYKKLLEEANEVVSSKNHDETLEELADVVEVVRSIAALEGKSLGDITSLADQKKNKRGGFQKRLFLEKNYSKDSR